MSPMKRVVVLVIALFAFACGGDASNQPVEAPGLFDPVGLNLVIGVERTKSITVKPDGSVVSTETGQPAMMFVGSELRLADANGGSKTLLTLDGNDLRGPNKSVGTFDGNTLLLGDARISVKDDGVVRFERNGSNHTMRMHFEGSVSGHRRPALMLVAVVFALYAATNPTATLDRFLD